MSIGKLEIAAPCRTDSSRVIVPKLINTVNGGIRGTVTNSQSTKEVPVNILMQPNQTDIAHTVQDLGQISRSSNIKSDLELLDSGSDSISNEADPDIDKSRKDSNSITNSIAKSIHSLKSHTEYDCHQSTIYKDTNRVSQLGEIPNKANES